MIYKRATRILESQGITDIEIVKRLYGAAPEYKAAIRQHSTCFPTATQAVQAVLHGFRPCRVHEGESHVCQHVPRGRALQEAIEKQEKQQ